MRQEMTIVPKSRAHAGKEQLGASGAAAVIAGALFARGPLGDWVMLDRREPTRARGGNVEDVAGPGHGRPRLT